MHNGKIPSFNELVQILRDRFAPDGYQQVHWSNFENRRKRSDETFLEYTDDLRKLIAKSHSHLSENKREERIFEQIRRSLTDEQLRILRIKEVWSLGPAIKALTAEENAERTSLTPWYPKPRETRTVAHIGMSDQPGQIGQISQDGEIIKLLKVIEQRMSQSHPQPNYQNDF